MPPPLPEFAIPVLFPPALPKTAYVDCTVGPVVILFTTFVFTGCPPLRTLPVL